MSDVWTCRGPGGKDCDCAVCRKAASDCVWPKRIDVVAQELLDRWKPTRPLWQMWGDDGEFLDEHEGDIDEPIPYQLMEKLT
jgi:hypothetical protein